MLNFLHAQTIIQIFSVFFTQSLWIPLPCLVLLSSLPPPCAAELPRIQHPLLKAHHDPPLSFLVVGDWGRKGFYNQSQVAQQMGIVGEELDIDFVISTGDNFYNDGLTGVRDPAFFQSFTNIYTAPSLYKPWYSVLGNHDYRGDAKAQLSRALRKRDRRWLCMRSFILQTGLVDFFFVDTTPMVDKYFQEIGKHTYDWRGVLPRNKYIRKVLKDVDSALMYSRGKWKIVVGHHTIKSAGHHGVTNELVHLLLPILQKNNVDFYFNGHDHCLERISDNKSGIEFITSGGGSKAWKGDVKAWNPSEELKMYHDGQGFVSMEITNHTANLKFYDVFGHILHQFTTFKQLHSDSDSDSDSPI